MNIQSIDESNPKIKRLRWQCRRGMLEVDLCLMRYLEREYINATPETQALFEVLLAEPDPVLLAWFTGQTVPKEPAIAQLVLRIRNKP